MNPSSHPSLTSRSASVWWVRGCWAIGALLFVLQLAEIPARSALRGYDNTFNYLWVRSAFVDQDWDFRNDIEQCDTLTPEYRAAALALPPTATGRLPNKYGIGWAVLTVPFYALADGTVAAGRALGIGSLERDGFNAIYQGFIQTGHAALAVLALLLAIRVVRGWTASSRSVEGVLVVWAASPLIYYQTCNLSMSHGAAFLAVATGAYGLQLARGGSGRAAGWLLAGVGFGLATVTRFQLVVFWLLPAWAFISAWREKLPGLRAALLGLIAGAAPFLLLQAWAWKVVYGRWLVFSYGMEGEGFNWARPEIAQSLFSPWHGLYYWHPLLLAATAGLAGWIWVQRGYALAVGGVFFATIYLNAAWWCWWFGSAFGNRSCDAALLPLMAGAAWIFERWGERFRGLVWAMVGAAVAWNIYLVVLYRFAAISRRDPVSWMQMLHAAGQVMHAGVF